MIPVSRGPCAMRFPGCRSPWIHTGGSVPGRGGETVRPDGCRGIRLRIGQRTGGTQVREALLRPPPTARRGARPGTGSPESRRGPGRGAPRARRRRARPTPCGRRAAPRCRATPRSRARPTMPRGSPRPRPRRTTGAGTCSPVGSISAARAGSTRCSFRTSGAAMARRGSRTAQCSPRRQTEQSQPSAACASGRVAASGITLRLGGHQRAHERLVDHELGCGLVGHGSTLPVGAAAGRRIDPRIGVLFCVGMCCNVWESIEGIPHVRNGAAGADRTACSQATAG